jgi:hypothetical protein
MCVEKRGHRWRRRRGASWLSEPRHSHDHRSASSDRGTRRSRLYCRMESFFAALASSRRSTSRRPFRSTAITSPWSASSRRRNQCFLASDALTHFMGTMYKTRWSGAR